MDTRCDAETPPGDAGRPGRLGLARGNRRQRRPPGAGRRPSTGCGPPVRTRSCAPRAAMSACRTGQMGNSEVGHLNIGAGRVVMQDLPRIGDAIATGEIETAPALTGLIDALQAERRHLPPDGPGLARRRALAPGPRRGAGENPRPTPACRRVVHAFTDGRDTPPQSAGDDLDALRAPRCRRRCRSPP